MKLEDLKRYGLHSRPTVRPTPPSTRIEGLLSGDIVPLSDGHSFFREERFDAAYQHGLHNVGDVRGVSGQRMSIISRDPELAYADLAQAVFLDTETTGLGMGVGTYVFLVGAGYLDGDSFRIRQFFLSGPGEETHFLQALDRFLREFSVIVTFNGKAFDWPLLEGRFARFKRPPPLIDPLHIDLLHPARRIWKRRLESCRLSSLERNLLRVVRTGDDVPGYEIPQRYFTYLRAGDAGGLEGVFYHNLQDILSLAALTVHIDRVLADPFAGLVHDALDIFCLGRVFERAGDLEPAVTCYEDALLRPTSPADRTEILVHLSGLQKRLRWWDGALATWDRLLDEGGQHAFFASVELAKYFEHVERDFASALDAAQRAARLIELHPDSWPAEEVAQLQHRLSRLLSRSARGRGRARSRM